MLLKKLKAQKKKEEREKKLGEENEALQKKIKKELNWKPEYSLDDGMKQVFNWLRN